MLLKEHDLILGKISLDFAKQTIGDFGKFMMAHPDKPKLDELKTAVLKLKNESKKGVKNSL